MVAEPSPTGDQAILGASIPYLNPHALSVSLPTWQDNLGWASGDTCIVDAMSTGYPRFFVHRKIQKVGSFVSALCVGPILSCSSLLVTVSRSLGGQMSSVCFSPPPVLPTCAFHISRIMPTNAPTWKSE